MKALVLTLAAMGAGLGFGLPAGGQPAPPALPAAWLCAGGDVAGQLAPVKVVIKVDAAGSVQGSWANWSLGGGDVVHAPAVQFDYPLTNAAPSRWPDGLNVLAVATLNPPPKAMTAKVVLSINGVDKASRPWSAYAKVRAALATAPQHPDAFFGVIAFYPDAASAADAGLVELLRDAGEPDAKLGVRIVGDDGSVLAAAAYGIDQPAVRAKPKIDAALAEALAKAKTPAQCRKQTG